MIKCFILMNEYYLLCVGFVQFDESELLDHPPLIEYLYEDQRRCYLWFDSHRIVCELV